jgi:hypothetical protein
MKMPQTFSLAMVLFGFLFLSSAVSAQSLYRCGSTYQDRPCEGKEQGKLVARTSSSSSNTAKTSDAQCAQRGQAALKIVWAREAGAMQDQQLAKARSGSEQSLINDVYARRGTSSEIRAAIEADCIAAKEKAARVAALLEAANGGQTSAPAPQGVSADANHQAQAMGASQSQDNDAREAAYKKKECDRLRSTLESVTRKQHAGASVNGMEELNQRKRDLDQQLRASGC